jgi:hypothetical protein
MVYCLMWTLLCQQGNDLFSWGPHSESLRSFLSENQPEIILLKMLPWCVQLLECWGMPQAQQDCGELSMQP